MHSRVGGVVFQNVVMTEEWTDWDGNGQFDAQVNFDPFNQPIRTNFLPKKLLSAP